MDAGYHDRVGNQTEMEYLYYVKFDNGLVTVILGESAPDAVIRAGNSPAVTCLGSCVTSAEVATPDQIEEYEYVCLQSGCKPYPEDR